MARGTIEDSLTAPISRDFFMQDDTLIKQKLDRAQNRGQFAVMDLFSGCGGLTLGFQRAGNICVSAIELNETAAKSHEINFKPAAPAGQYRVLGDITKVSPSEAITHLVSKDEHLDSPIDLIIGGGLVSRFLNSVGLRSGS